MHMMPTKNCSTLIEYAKATIQLTGFVVSKDGSSHNLKEGKHTDGIKDRMNERQGGNAREFLESILLKDDFQSVQFSEQAEILLFAGENVALKLNR